MLDLLVGSRRGEFELELALQARGGSTTVIVGESGAGKTSVLRLAAGLDRPVTGRIVLDGEVYTDTAADIHVPPWRRSVGYVSQDYALFPHLSVAENVELPLTYRTGMPAAERKKRVQESLERVNMAHRMRHYPAQLSGGQQRRVAVARALVGSPSILLADEPTGNLDSKNGEQVMALLADLHADGATICIVTHDPRYAEYADRKIHMFDGRVVDEETLNRLREEEDRRIAEQARRGRPASADLKED